MKIQFVCATDLEAKISPLPAFVHGIGLMETAANLSKCPEADFYIQYGIAGLYPKHKDSFAIGDCLFIQQEVIADLGTQTDFGFLNLNDLNLAGPSAYLCPSHNPTSLPEVSSLSVNNCTGTLDTAIYRENRFNAQIESMEGAAFFKFLNLRQAKGIQIRSISNIASARNTDTWNIPLALKKLKAELCKLT